MTLVSVDLYTEILGCAREEEGRTRGTSNEVTGTFHN